MTEWIDIGDRRRFRRGRGRTVRAGTVDIAVFDVSGKIYAIQDACPHMGASLSDGRVTGGKVVCSWHGWGFDLADGRSDMRDWACARTYETKVVDGKVLVRIPPPAEPSPATEEPEEWIHWDPQRFFRSGAGED